MKLNTNCKRKNNDEDTFNEKHKHNNYRHENNDENAQWPTKLENLMRSEQQKKMATNMT